MKFVRGLKKILLVILTVTLINSVLDPIGMVCAIGDIKESMGIEQNYVNNETEQIYTNEELYKDGTIFIYNEKQLQAIGTGQVIHMEDKTSETFGSGNVILDDEGQAVLYSQDATYQLMNDIELNYENMWSLPENFTGKFINEDKNEDKVLYDQENDTIHIFNNYQLLTIKSNEQLKTVLSGDKTAKTFGTGQIVYADESKQVQLEYTNEHKYVLDTSFTSDMPELASKQILADASDTDTEGRQYEGQVIYYENNVQYILIGNKQQLQAIGKTDEGGNLIKVTEPLWERNGNSITGYTWKKIYNGDADLKQEDDEEPELWGNKKICTIGALTGNIIKQDYYGSALDKNKNVVVNKDNTKHHVNIERKDGDDFDPVYSSTANYIIFRNIDLSGVDWQPLMFSGQMEGRLNMQQDAQVTISNIDVVPATTTENGQTVLDTSKNTGIGFFGTITNQQGGTNSDGQLDVGISAGTTCVKNIKLSNIDVNNQYDKAASGETLVSGLLDIVGGLLGAVGGILDGILGGLGQLTGTDKIFGNTNLKDLLTGLFNIRQNAPDTFATGTFAGRIIGDVEVSDCQVIDGSVSNVGNMTGGFVGTVEGLTEYDGLSELLGEAENRLTGILNVIPGLGLGDLITFLLDNPSLISTGQLIPSGYKKATIKNCSVQLKSNDSTIGRNDTKFNGGFAGMQTGSDISNCSVTNLTEVKGSQYVGGFTGATRDAVIKGLLGDGVDIQLPNLDISSKTTECTVDGTNIQITASEKYAGGFTGIVANSDISNSSVNKVSSVTAKGDYAGGFAGRATLGSSVVLGTDEDVAGNKGLLGTATDIVKGLLTNNTNPGSLLNLLGVSASQLQSCSVTGANLTVSADKYAGGLFGAGDGTEVSGNNTVTNINTVKATQYAGGVAGKMVPANAAGVIDETLGIANVLQFDVNNINVTFTEGGTVTGEYSGGAFGQVMGGKIKKINIDNLSKAEGTNYVGGFVGMTAPGSIADAAGLNILGLVKVDNLLSVAEVLATTIDSSKVSGANLSVTATNNDSTIQSFAGGFIGNNYSADISNSNVEGLSSVTTDNEKTNSYAGGFVGISQVGGLAQLGDDNTLDSFLGDNDVLQIESLLSAVNYLIPSYTNCQVHFNSSGDPQVSAAHAGGFVGEMQGGTVDNTSEQPYAVYNLKLVEGTYKAGGFAGSIQSAGLASSDGLTLFDGAVKLDVTQLVSLFDVYIPKVKNAGVLSAESEDKVSESLGLRVITTYTPDNTTIETTYAGGFVGLAQGAQIEGCNVKNLATKSPIEELEDLEVLKDYDYAVVSNDFAGGFAGKIDIGSAAAVGDSLSVFAIIELNDLTRALNVVYSKVTQCDVYGATGGFNILSEEGSAGGYAGNISGSILNDSDSYNFECIDAQISAGGYVGTLEPGDVASVIDDANVSELINVGNLLSVAKTFVPAVYNSETTAVPCGGYVRADGTSKDGQLEGLAGGYVGYNLGGQIAGNKEVSDSPALLKRASAIRIRSVIGNEFAGGFTGLMKAANVADTGSLKILNSIELNNPLSVLEAIYATQTNTQVTGPLHGVTLDVWNSWVEAVGSKGPYGQQFTTKYNSQDELDKALKQYIYGYTVKTEVEDKDTGVDAGGCAGGYVGSMEAGIIENAHAQDVQSVTAYRSAGGFVGEAKPGDVANPGNIKIGDLTAVNNLGLVETFVPVIKQAKVSGYQSGMTVEATAAINNDLIGNAGGFVGNAFGLQVLDVDGQNSATAIVEKLKTVKGHQYIGGFAGQMQAGMAANVDATSESGLLNQILGLLIDQDTVSDLANVLQATRTTVHTAEVSGINQSLQINGNKGQKATAAGGFAGKLTGALIGKNDNQGTSSIKISGLSTVYAGKYAGGFFGIADVDGLVELANGNTNILDLLGLNSIDILNIFKTYIYSATVEGSTTGLYVQAKEETELSTLDKIVSFFTGESSSNMVYKDGNAGGFGGSLMSSYVENAHVINLMKVTGLNNTGGFVGLSGKSGLVDADNANVLKQLLDISAGVLDIFGSHIDNCEVTGHTNSGFMVKSNGGSEEIAGGFVGYGDLSRINNCHVNEIKQVASEEIAGGFIGKASYEYLVQADVSSPALLNPVLKVVDGLLDILYADKLQDSGVLTIQLPGNLGEKVLAVELLSDGNTLSVTLLGIKISVALVKNEVDGETDVAQVHIGDSYIELPCYNEDQNTNDDYRHFDEETNIKLGLIKANRTKVTNSKIEGIDIGYDVFGGGATNTKDGTAANGYAGGFVGYNNEGLFENNEMIYCDTIRGTADLVGEFSGKTELKTEYENINNLNVIEGNNNIYYVYRLHDDDNLNQLNTNNDETITDQCTDESIADNVLYYKYSVTHRNLTNTDDPSRHESVWKDAYQTTIENPNAKFPVKVFVSKAQANLMLGTPTEETVKYPEKNETEMQDPCSENAELRIQKLWYDDVDESQRPQEITIEIHQKNGESDIILQKVVLTSENADADGNSWSTSISVPVNDKDGNKYQYYIVEVISDGNNKNNQYVAIYSQSDDGYTFYISNYLTDELAQEDTVVIDYGLAVDVDVLTNDRFEEDGITGTLEAVGPFDPNTEETATATLAEDFVKYDVENNVYEATYGTAKVEKADANDANPSIIHYQPNTMNMTSYDRMLYAVKLDDKQVKNNQNYVYGMLTVVPATEIFYEDNFSAIKYTNAPGAQSTENTDSDEIGVWQDETTLNGTSSDHQDTDRPGSDAIDHAWDDWYGNDSHYEDDYMYSNATAKKVTVNETNNTKEIGSPTAEFEFTGTGFDAISVTSSTTGVVKVDIYEESVNQDKTGNTIWNEKAKYKYTIDTYYGYTYNDGKWEVNKDAEDALYQIPILKVEDLTYGHYKVVITPTYRSYYDHKEAGHYDFYLDAIRIYDPADSNNEEYKVIEDVYKQDGENNPRFTEIRDLLLNANNMTELQEEGTVFVDGNGTEHDMDEYESYGPKNEVYLAPGQGISFYLWTNQIPDKVQLSAKLAMGNETNLTIAAAVPIEGSNEEGDIADRYQAFKKDIYTVKTAYDLYYDFADKCVWEKADGENPFRTYKTKYPIVIYNDGEQKESVNQILSLTNLQWTGEGNNDDISSQPKTREKTVDSGELIATANLSNVKAAYQLLNAPETYTMTIQYVDKNGTALANDTVLTLDEGSSYDMNSYLEKEIDGYTYVRHEGDDLTGTMDGNKVIKIVYQKSIPSIPLEYSVNVRYVDTDGNQIADPYIVTGLNKNEKYDVTDQTAISLEGYEFVEVQGDDIKGEADANKVITVVYKKAKYTLTVYYVDENGNEIDEAYIEKDVEYGSSYDLTQYINHDIKGYEKIDVRGDNMTGQVKGSIVIHVIYAKEKQLTEPVNYRIIVRYVDTNGKEIADSFVLDSLQSGDSYDITKYTEKQIKGYDRLYVQGDNVTGVVDSHKVITVVYQLKSTSTQNTDTGDHQQIFVYVWMSVLSLSLLSYFVWNKLKRKKKES